MKGIYRGRAAPGCCLGYFTVEAALIMPFVLAVILLVTYMWFFKYDRCLMEQDFAWITVRSIMARDKASGERVEYAEKLIKQLYTKEYFAWKWGASSASIDKGELTVEVSGQLTFPFSGLAFWDGGNTWKAERSYTGGVISPMFGIRTYRKLEGVLGFFKNQ